MIVGGPIILPWPGMALSPNGQHGSHWRLATARKAQQQAAYLAAREAFPARPQLPPDGDIFLWTRFFPKDRRRRDRDNFTARMKGAYDAIADWLGVDDKRFFPLPLIMEPDGRQRVEVTLQTGRLVIVD